MGEKLVDIFAIVFLFGGPILGWVTVRYMAHRERMATIMYGRTPQGLPPDPGRWQAAAPRYRPGPALDEVAAARATLRKGIVVAFVGLALTFGLSFIGVRDGSFVFGPWMLGGLIPMFVGIAQIVIALLSGATLSPGVPAGPYGPQAPSPPPPGAAAQPPGAPGAPFEGSYTYRPGSTTELRPPPAPPDRL